jgi:hypothetical protein
MAKGLFMVLVLCGGVLANMPASAQFKCRQPDGSTAYQQTPCAGNQSEQRIGAPASPSVNALPDPAAKEAQAKVKAQAAEADRRLRIRSAIESRRPAVGMTRQELELAMGRPTRLNTDTSTQGVREQWVYQGQNQTLYVYTDGREVTSFSQRDDFAGAAKKAECPTAAQIRDLEIEASKFMNRGDERKQADIGKKLEKARACRTS